MTVNELFLSALMAGITGAVIIIIGVLIGAFIMYRAKSTPGEGGGFLKEPKGAAFTIPDEGLDAEPDFSGEPSEDEQNILKRTERFLGSFGE